MQLGVGLSQRFQPELAREIERLGFDAIWVGGHIMWHAPTLEPLMQLAGYAAITERIRLGTGILLLPLYHPVLAAKMATTLDVMSGGRALLGVGVGGEHPAEFEAMGVPVSERGRRTDAAITRLRALWEGEQSPRPVQSQGIPIWVAGRSEHAHRRAAELGDGWIGIFLDSGAYAETVRAVRARRADVTCAHYLWVRVGDPAGARAYLERSYGRDFTPEQARRFCVDGTFDEVRERVAAYAAAGCDHLILKPACEPDELADQVAALAALRREPAQR